MAHDPNPCKPRVVAPRPGKRSAAPRSLVSTGMVPAGASGVRDYGHLLGDELRRRGKPVDEVWVVNDGHRLVGSLRASARLLGWGLRVPSDTQVVWHYSSFAYGWRGIPLPGVVLGLLLGTRGIQVLTVLHEPAYPWGRRGMRGRLQAVTQWMALPLVVLGSSAVVVTTARRAALLRRLPRPLRREVHDLAVFSTVEVATVGAGQPEGEHGSSLGLLGYTGDGARPDLLFEALGALGPPPGLRVVLIGAPGPESPDGCLWTQLAAAAGLADIIEFTGVVPPEELSRRLQACDMAVLLNEYGPSSRRTTLAVALAHGMPIVALDGPDGWSELALEGAALIVPCEPQALATALDDLLADPSRRRDLGLRARRFYEHRMGITRVADAITEVLMQL